MLSAIAKPFGVLLMWLYELTANYGVAVILFALIVKLILLPFQMKSKRSTMKTSRLQGRMKEIEKKHGANKQKYNEEVQKLYREEGINPMSGCLWSLLPFPILIALYQAIRYPITIMMGVAADLLAEGGAIASKLTELGFETTVSKAYEQIAQSQFITAHWDSFSSLSDKLRQIDYSFLGLDLGKQPSIKIFWQGDWSDPATISIACLAIIPLLAAVLSYVQSKVSMKTNPTPSEDDQTAKTMNSMTIIMPLITLWFAFAMPAALGVYWIASSVFAIIQDVLLNKYYGKKLAAEFAEKDALRAKKEQELEEKRRETERLKAENATTVNTNTSKKKLHLSEREKQKGKAKEWQKKKEGEVSDEPSRVGDRKYARGRAYDPDRYSGEKQEPEETPEEEAPAPAEEIPAAEENVQDVFDNSVDIEDADAEPEQEPEEEETENDD